MTQYVIRCLTDPERGVQRLPLGQLFAAGDEAAHCFRIRLKDGKPAGQIRGYFLRGDGETVLFSGSIEGDEAVAVLPAACYSAAGAFSLIVKEEGEEASTAICWATGRIVRSSTDTLVDPEAVVPSLSELLAQISRIEEAVGKAEASETASAAAVARAETAAVNAETAATNADAAASAGNTAAGRANTAASNADAAAARADSAANAADEAASAALTAAGRVETAKSGAESAAASANSAAQEALAAAEQAIEGPFRYRGSVSGEEALPEADNETGDVRSDSLTGICWVWDGARWITLAENLTFSGRVTSVNGKTGEVELGFGGNDIVKLWTNSGGVNDAFQPQSVSLIPEGDSSTYTGFIFYFRERPAEYRQLNEVTSFAQFVPYDAAFTDGVYNRAEHASSVLGGVVSREYSFSLPSVLFGQGALDGTADNYCCVPTAVYGIRDAGENILSMGDFYGASATRAGTHGLVPAPAVPDRQKYLRGDGSWDLPQLSGLSTVWKHAEVTESVTLPATTTTTVLQTALEPGYLWLVCGGIGTQPSSSGEGEVIITIGLDGVNQCRQASYNGGTLMRAANCCCIVSTIGNTADAALCLNAYPRSRSVTYAPTAGTPQAFLSAVRIASALEDA